MLKMGNAKSKGSNATKRLNAPEPRWRTCQMNGLLQSTAPFAHQGLTINDHLSERWLSTLKSTEPPHPVTSVDHRSDIMRHRLPKKIVDVLLDLYLFCSLQPLFSMHDKALKYVAQQCETWGHGGHVSTVTMPIGPCRTHRLRKMETVFNSRNVPRSLPSRSPSMSSKGWRICLHRDSVRDIQPSWRSQNHDFAK